MTIAHENPVILLGAILCALTPLSAQTYILEKETTLSDLRINAVAQASNGLLIAAGERFPASAPRVALLDAGDLRLLKSIVPGGDESGAFYALAQTPSGQIAAGGAYGKKAAVFWYDIRGTKLRSRSFGATGKSEVRALQALDDDGLLLAGHLDGRSKGDLWIARLDAQGETRWEKHHGREEFATLAACVATPDGRFAIAGNTGKKAPGGSGDVYVALFDAQGGLLWKKFFGEKDWEEALALAPTPDGGFAIAGLTKSKGAGETDCWLIRVGRDGARLWDKTYGGKNADLAAAVCLTPSDGGFLLAGRTLSHRSGARTPMGFLVKTARGGDLLWEYYAGSDKSDEFSVLRQLYDGAFVAAGVSAGKAWVARFRSPDPAPTYAGIRDAGSVRIVEARLAASGEKLAPGASSYLSLQLNNATDLDLSNLQISVEGASGGLQVWQTNYTGALARSAQTLAYIPVSADVSASEGSCTLRIVVSAGEKTLATLDKSIVIEANKPAELGIADYQFAPSSASDEVVLRVQLTNNGDLASGPLELSFNCPAGIVPAGQAVQALGALPGRSKRDVKFVFTKKNESNPIRIGVVARESGIVRVNKTLEWSAGSGRGVLSDKPIVIWTDPAPHETGTTRIRKTDDHFEFKNTVISPQQVKPSDFKMIVNGVNMEGSKFREEDLSAPSRDEGYYIYSYRNKIPLAIGSNKIQISVDGQLSDMIEVIYEPQRANLHLLCIGPRHDDLKYTAKDATDIAEAFKGQGGEGRLFGEVNIWRLTEPAQTDLAGLKKAFLDLAYLWDDSRIGSNDLLIVFVSSHGKIVKDRFKVLQTGYDPRYESITLDFKTDILDVLSPINCKKLLLIDACHSGGAKDGLGALSRALTDIARTQPGISTLSSCSSAEKSYEDKVWSNGAFTHAILEALCNAECADTDGRFRADTDGDGVLRLGELYAFLRRRVPYMVSQTIPNAPTTQTPYMPENLLDMNMPLFLIKK